MSGRETAVGAVAAPVAAGRGRGGAGTRARRSCRSTPRSPRAEIATLLDRLRPTHVDGAAQLRRRRPAPAGTAAIVVTSGTEGAPKGVELTRAGHGGDGPRLLRRPRRRAGRPLARVPAAAPRREPRRARPLVRHRRAVHGARRASTSNASRARRAPRARRSSRSCRPRCGGCSTPARRCTSSAVVITGGAPCPPALRARAEAAGVAVVDAYGLSETWGGFALDGVPIAGAEVRLARRRRDPRARRDGDARRTASTRTAPRRCSTPTAGSTPATSARSTTTGASRVVDRLKDLVITGGVNVSPTEVEGVLAHHPDVARRLRGRRPRRRVGRAGGRVRRAARRCADAPSVDELRAFARERLSGPKLPRAVRVVDAIPRTASGKPLRRLLRDATRARRQVIEPTNSHRARRRVAEERGGRLEQPVADLRPRRAPLDRGDAVAHRELVVDELVAASSRSGPRRPRRRRARIRPASRARGSPTCGLRGGSG